MKRSLVHFGMIMVLALWLPACAAPSVNALFPADDQIVAAERARMIENPITLERPLVVLAGYRSTQKQPSRLSQRLRQLTSQRPEDFLAISYFWTTNFEDAARRVVEEVEHRWPSTDPERTVEVDVVGVSMGGLIARLAASGALRESDGATKTLHVRTLYTLSTPHRGATLADLIALDPAARAMKTDSPMLRSLDESQRARPISIVPYARTGDWTVGARQAAPPGMDPVWVVGPTLFSHTTISYDWRIIIDIARRLRGEWPLAFRGSPPPSD